MHDRHDRMFRELEIWLNIHLIKFPDTLIKSLNEAVE